MGDRRVSHPITWYRSPLDRARLQELTAKSDWKALLHAGGFLLLFLASVAVNLWLFLSRRWGLLVVGCVLHSMLVNYMGMGAAVHELSHGTAFKTKWLNEMFIGIFAFFTWNNQLHFRASHAQHHQNTYFHEYDREQMSVPIPTEVSLLKVISWCTFDVQKFVRFFHANISYALGRTDVDFFYWCPLLPPSNAKSRAMFRWARVLLIGHALLIALFAITHLWILIFLVSFAYFFVSIWDHCTGILQHMGLRGDVPDWRLNSYTIDLGPIHRFFYWNMNFHTEHHMYAAVPFYNLPRLRKEIGWDLQKPLRGFWTAIFHIVRVQRRQKQEPEYRYMPEFPETATRPRLE